MTTAPPNYTYGSYLPKIDTCDHSDVPSVEKMTKCVTTHRHFIPPVPPTYVTEYEANFRWPPSNAYTQVRNYIGRQLFAPGTVTVDGSFAPSYIQLSPRGTLWSQLGAVVNKLFDVGYERSMLSTVRNAISARRFDSVLEYAYAHFQDALRTDQPQMLAEPSDRTDGKESVATSADIACLTPETFSLCRKFVEIMDAIKAA